MNKASCRHLAGLSKEGCFFALTSDLPVAPKPSLSKRSAPQFEAGKRTEAANYRAQVLAFRRTARTYARWWTEPARVIAQRQPGHQAAEERGQQNGHPTGERNPQPGPLGGSLPTSPCLRATIER